MILKKVLRVLTLLSYGLCCLNLQASTAPPLLLAKKYHDSLNVEHYWVSEKLDGVRAYWDGNRLLSKSGREFTAPAWFTSALPAITLDGELWIERGKFAEVVSVVNKHTASDTEWHQLKYMLFDAPDPEIRFSERIVNLKSVVAEINTDWIRMIPQERFNNQASLQDKLQQIVQAGGEGLMLHHEDARYRAGRTNDLLKLKQFNDAEAHVIAHIPGKGKFSGLLGALLVEDDEGLQFRIGTGFKRSQREQPPAIGSQITYRYTGRTKTGLPRFPVFMRIRLSE